MSRLTNPVPQFLDDAGDPLIAGKLYFYETGSLTAKNTYADSALTIANTNPVILDGSGRTPNVFFDGVAKVILTDGDDLQEWERDPVGSLTSDTQLADWDSTTTYAQYDLVQGSTGTYYRSTVANNVDLEPSANPTEWEEILTTREDATGRGSDAVAHTGASRTVTATLDGYSDGSVALAAPDITSYENATHDHTDAAGGGIFNSVAQLGTALDTDPTLAADSDAKVASQKATKAAIDAEDAVDVRGYIDGTSFNGTYSQTLTEATYTKSTHGVLVGQLVDITHTTGAGVDGSYTVVTVADADTFTVTSGVSQSTSGNMTVNSVVRDFSAAFTVTDNGAGDYTITFNSAFSTALFTFLASVGTSAGAARIVTAPHTDAPTTTTMRVLVTDAAGTPIDTEFLYFTAYEPAL